MRDDKINILICDHSLENAESLRSMLLEKDINSDIANTAKEVDLLLEKNHYDVIVLDLLLPDVAGVSYIKKIRENEKTKTIPLVVISVEIDKDKKALNGDAFLVIDWVEQPISKIQISNIVEHITKMNIHKIPNILSVEDDKDVVQVISILLQDKANVFGANTLHEASELLKKHSFDLVILDLNMPDGLGTSLLPCINYETKKPIPIVVFSIDELDRKFAPLVNKALLKSVVSNEQLFLAIETAIQSGSNQ